MAEEKAFTLKLLLNKATNKVLFAEAPKEVVDFLFGLLEMPLGSVVKFLTSERMVGAIGNLFRSVASLDATYLQSDHARTNLLDPSVRSSASYKWLLRPPATTSDSDSVDDETCRYFRCSNLNSSSCNTYISSVSKRTCPSCRREMTQGVTLLETTGSNDELAEGAQIMGYVKKIVTYTITDDLTVTPMSTISAITLLSKYNVKDVGVLEERVVKLGFEQGLEMLRSSLQSKTVLSDVFLPRDSEARK